MVAGMNLEECIVSVMEGSIPSHIDVHGKAVSQLSPRMVKFLNKEKDRVQGVSFEGQDGVFIYCDSAKWCDDSGSGTFRGDTETKAIKRFYDQIRKGDGTYR